MLLPRLLLLPRRFRRLTLGFGRPLGLALALLLLLLALLLGPLLIQLLASALGFGRQLGLGLALLLGPLVRLLLVLSESRPAVRCPENQHTH